MTLMDDQRAPHTNTGFTPAPPKSQHPILPESDNALPGIFFHEGHSANYAYFPSSGNKPVVIAFAGLNDPEALSLEEKRKLNDAGFPVLDMAFVATHGKGGFIPKQKSLMRGMLTHPDSPLYQMHGDRPKFHILAHSTSAMTILDLMREPATLKRIKDSQPVLVSPPFEPPFASKDHPFSIAGMRPLSILFERVARANLDRSMTDSFGTRVYHALRGQHKNHEKYADAPRTWRQAMEVFENSRRVMDDFNYKAAASAHPLFIAGDCDPYTRLATTRKQAEKMGSDIIIVHGGHHSLHLEREAVFELVVSRWLGKDPKPARQSLLSNGPRLTLQGGTGFLNPAASLL